jgi:hypothetical protein
LTWFRRQIGAAPFPDPPWAGNEWLRPVRDGAALKRLARVMENCAAGYLEEILKGENYIYAVKDPPVAVVLLEYDFFCGWAIDELKGPKNRAVRGPLRRRILDAFAAAGIEALHSEIRQSVSGLLHQWDADD